MACIICFDIVASILVASLHVALRTYRRISGRIPEDNAPGSDAYHCGAHVGSNGLPTFEKGLGMPTHLEATRLPRGQHIVYQKRRQAIAGNIAKLLRIRYV